MTGFTVRRFRLTIGRSASRSVGAMLQVMNFFQVDVGT